MEQTGFWAEPDIEATAKNANMFLSKQCQRLSLRAGVSLSSPQLSKAPMHTNGVNHAEEGMVNSLAALTALQAIKYTMLHTRGVSPQLLISKYLDLKKEWQVRQDIHISHNAYPKYRERALYEFAESWNTTQEKFNFEDKVDLIIYKRNFGGIYDEYSRNL
ncbi:ArpU family transcriptional regulator [Lactobacillus sp. ESL0236]|uniref:ArpU family phage packaging/lysis transcriptional regulator n=1 Tax=unclassified Lactobacillus TaxID=2620435 RepID=UPI000EFBA6CE|nr:MULTISPECIES: ArpU family phage packaging/lysis transcriptional regulator [unclassified Lactobacillus]RMC35997.1 ArpU family transcriptional regulator [Lactobacillus sp. ESL0237]RMC42503.1 ArpU family transcriptional regulator [Lactobacillus sp. ESL0234]RMC43488.1 ArpU family transcriptional regulator [Lactobacillus sp. ESL0236]